MSTRILHLDDHGALPVKMVLPSLCPVECARALCFSDWNLSSFVALRLTIFFPHACARRNMGLQYVTEAFLGIDENHC